MVSSTNPNTVKTARRTLQILNSIKDKNGATLTELVDDYDISKSSMHNYLTTLKEDGYVVKEKMEYRVGLRILDLGGHARHHRRIYNTAKEEVTSLAEETGEMANLLVEEQGRGIYLHRAHGEHAVMTDSYVGQQVYLHHTALGHAIMAHIPHEQVEAILDQHGMPPATENTIVDREALFEKLDTVRERGFALDDEARLRGLRCVAVPIINNRGKVEGALSVSGPTSRFQGKRFRSDLPDQLKRVANIVELNTTYA